MWSRDDVELKHLGGQIRVYEAARDLEHRHHNPPSPQALGPKDEIFEFQSLPTQGDGIVNTRH